MHRARLALRLIAFGLAACAAPASGRAQVAFVVRSVRLTHAPSAPVLSIQAAPRDSALARRLAEAAAAFDPRVFPHVPAGTDTVRIFLAPDQQSFRRASGGLPPDWGLAVAFPREAAIVMRPPRLVGSDVQDPAQVLAHELVHVYLGLYLGPREPAAPRWFHEGLASLLAGEWGWTERFDLALALAARRPIPLERLEDGFPAGREAAGLAYLESLTAVASLRALSGEEGLTVLLANLRRSGDFDAAMRRTYGLTYGEFTERWATTVASRYGWAAAAASSWTWWTPAAVLLVLLVIWRRLVYRARLEELRRRERLELADEAAAFGGQEGEVGEAGPEVAGRAGLEPGAGEGETPRDAPPPAGA